MAREHYCAKCGRLITTIHIIIPTTGLRYHRECEPLNEPIEVLVSTGGRDYH
jgi:hypothetical protein